MAHLRYNAYYKRFSAFYSMSSPKEVHWHGAQLLPVVLMSGNLLPITGTCFSPWRLTFFFLDFWLVFVFGVVALFVFLLSMNKGKQKLMFGVNCLNFKLYYRFVPPLGTTPQLQYAYFIYVHACDITFVFKVLRNRLLGIYFTHVQTCDNLRVQSATQPTGSVHTLHTHVQTRP